MKSVSLGNLREIQLIDMGFPIYFIIQKKDIWELDAIILIDIPPILKVTSLDRAFFPEKNQEIGLNVLRRFIDIWPNIFCSSSLIWYCSTDTFYH